MILDNTNVSHPYDGAGDSSEVWEHTYREEQHEESVLVNILVICAGIFIFGIGIPLFPATIIERFFPAFPSYIVCCTLGLALIAWLLYHSYNMDSNVAVSVGNNGIKFYTKSGKCTQYSTGQYINTSLYRIKSRGGVILHTYYVNMREDNGEKKAIPCDFLSGDDMGRLIKDLDRLKESHTSQTVPAQNHSSCAPCKVDNKSIRNVYTYPREKVERKMQVLKRWLLGILIFCIVLFVAGIGYKLYIDNNNPSSDWIIMLSGVPLCIAYIDMLFLILLPSRYKSLLPEMVSRVELMQDGLQITRKDRIAIPVEDIRYIRIHHQGYCVQRKFGVRNMTIQTNSRTIVCHMGFHPESNESLAMQDYGQFYSDIYRWAKQHGVECFDDVAPQL